MIIQVKPLLALSTLLEMMLCSALTVMVGTTTWGIMDPLPLVFRGTSTGSSASCSFLSAEEANDDMDAASTMGLLVALVNSLGSCPRDDVVMLLPRLERFVPLLPSKPIMAANLSFPPPLFPPPWNISSWSKRIG